MGMWDRVSAAGRALFTASEERTPPGSADDYWYGPIGQKTGAGIVVTPQVALKASAVFACINKIAKVMSTIPCETFKVGADKTLELDEGHELAEVLGHQFNENDTAVDGWHFLIWNALLRGTGYARIAYEGSRISGLYPMATAHVQPEVLSSGRWRFKYRDPLRQDLGEQIISQDDIFRFPGLVPNGVAGMGICECADEAVAVSIAADQYAARVFQNNLNMGFILSHPGKMNDESKKRFLEAITSRLAGVANAHRPLLVQDGIKVEKVSQTAQEAQLIEARKWQLAEICRALDMPGSMVGIEDNAGGKSSVEEHTLNFSRFTLQPWARKIEQAARRDLILADLKGKRTHVVRFNFDELLRANTQARADYLSKALGSGGSPAWMSVNEARRKEGLKPLKGEEYEKPATGTNPISPEKGGPTKPTKPGKPQQEEPADEGDEEARPAKSRPKQVDDKAALLRKELTALRKAARRHAGDVDAWRDYAKVFYGGLASDVMRRLKVEKRVARQYCEARTKQCFAKSPQAVIEHLEANGATEIEYFVAS